jgi:hypothetical protein
MRSLELLFSRRLAAGLLVAVAGLTSVGAQAGDKFHARLSPLPVTGATVSTIAGVGSVTATLSGSRLTIDGTFSGLAGPATVANVRRAPKAMRGPELFELTVTKDTNGRVSGAVDLTPEQVEDLRAGRLYVQIHSDRAPEGSIRGWLLP